MPQERKVVARTSACCRMSLTVSALAVLLSGVAQAQSLPGQADSPQPQPAPAVPAASAAVAPTPVASAADALLDQGSYWRTRAPDQAIASLNRLLTGEPDNASALAMLIQIDIDQNQLEAAKALLQHLRTVHPDDPRLADLDAPFAADKSTRRPRPGPAFGGRRQAGRSDPGLSARLQECPPSDAYAGEYYLTLGSVDGHLDEAQAGLATVLRKNPQDLTMQLAYAKLLSYSEATRADAVDRLQALCKFPSIADEVRIAWRSALLWQGADYRAQAQLETYLQQFPSDPQLDAKREDYKGSLPDEGARDRLAAYQAMQDKNIPEAEKQFQAALTFNPKDVDSMIMMAVIRKQQNRPAEAKQLADAAMALAPDRHDDFVAAMGGNAPATANGGSGSDGSALVRGEYARVGRLAGRGDYAGAEAALRRLMRGKPPAGAYVQLGYIQLRAGRLAAAEASFRQAIRLSPHDKTGLRGLAGLYAREGNNSAAEALYIQIGDKAALETIAQLQSSQLRTQASNATGPAEKERLLRPPSQPTRRIPGRNWNSRACWPTRTARPRRARSWPTSRPAPSRPARRFRRP
ncbi:MAG: tetratricopeptide repeat protein [Acetobacteraceae bacterium]